jgi:hypothetical protein
MNNVPNKECVKGLVSGPAGNVTKLLIVDDLPENLRALNAIIRADDRAVYQATSGEEASNTISRWPSWTCRCRAWTVSNWPN